MRNVTLTIEWEITGPAGDSMLAESCGEAADSGDKAVSKAHSVAYRTLLLQALAVPTGDREPDADSHERATPAGPDPRAEGWRAIEAKGAALGLSPAAVRGDYLAKQGHEIDGPESTPDTLRDYYRAMGAEPAAAKTGGDTDPWQTPAPPTVDVPLPDAAGYDPMGLDGGDK